MGFYGNITNINKTTPYPDLTYPNRVTMEANAQKDGVYIGRYVLVDYDATDSVNTIQASVKCDKDGNIIYVAGSNQPQICTGTVVDDVDFYKSDENLLTFSSDKDVQGDHIVHAGDLIEITQKLCYNPNTNKTSVLALDDADFIYYYVSGGNTSTNLPYYSSLDNTSIYGTNYQIDYRKYKVGRGYDSTLWQKTIANDGSYKYVMVAELNSVVPTFDVISEAPTVTPLKPHWDVDNSNLYYLLHVQPSWGFRVKSKSNDRKYNTKDPETYFSDVKGDYLYEMKYEDTPNGKVEPKTLKDTDLAIYYNEKGFNEYSDFEYSDIQNLKDCIKAAPTGYSSNKYYSHEYFSSQAEIPDTYELSIMLPSIGKTFYKVWNTVYGEPTTKDLNGTDLWDRKNDQFAQGGNKNVRNVDIRWNSTAGHRLLRANGANAYNYGTDKDHMYSLASAINTTHDLIGMIIRPYTDDVANWDPTKIYYKKGDGYYRKGVQYTYTPVDSTALKQDYHTAIPVSDFVKINSGTYYRKSEERSPIYYNNDETVNEELSDNIYYNYMVGDENPIDNAQYGTIGDPGNAVELKTDYTKGTVYSSNANRTVYILDESELPSNPTGIYYKISDIKQVVDNKKFYEPNRYYVVIKKDGNWNGGAPKDGKYDSVAMCRQTTYQSLMLDLKNYTASQYKFFDSKKNYISEEPSKEVLTEDTANPDYKNGINTSSLSAYTKNSDGSYTLHFKYNINKDGFGVYASDGGYEKIETIPASDVNTANHTYRAPLYTCKTSKDDVVDTTTGQTLLDIMNSTTTDYPYQIHLNDDKTLDQVFKLMKATVPPTYKFNFGKGVEPSSVATEFRLPVDMADYYFNNYGVDEKTKQYKYWGKYLSSDDQQSKLRLEDNKGNNLAKPNLYTVTISKQLYYYTPHQKVYYKDAKGDYVRELADKISIPMQDKSSPNYRAYYSEAQLHWTPITKRLFVPNKYYYRVEENNSTYSGPYHYLPATELKGHTQLYTNDCLYVLSSDVGVYPKGMEWPATIQTIPSGVTLATRQENIAAVKIANLGVDKETLLGQIVEINHLLGRNEPNDESYTRDTSTVQGAINRVNDLAARFDTLTPAEPVMVDAYGRIHSGDYDSKQTSGYTNVGRPNASQSRTTGEGDNQRWIKMTTSSGTATGYKPHIKLEHTFRAAADTTTQSNLNSDEKYSGADAGLNVTAGDKLKLYTPIVDSTGHVVGKNTETVTLPYGFKFIDIGSPISDSLTTDKLAASGHIRADNTQDKFTINPANKWIRMTGTDDENGETITIAHEIHSFDKSNLAAVNLNGNGDTITLQENQYDAAGHMTKSQNRTYTLPYDFKTIGTNGRKSANNTTQISAQADVIAKNTQDKFNLNSGNEWLRVETDASTNTLTLFHDVKNTTATTSTLNLSSTTGGMSFAIPSYGFDATNHFSSKDIKTVTMPNNYGIITGDSGTSEASATHDSFAILSGDKWLETKVEKDKITLTHTATAPTATTSAQNLSTGIDSTTTFDIPIDSYDATNHFSSRNTKTITMPNSYGIITGDTGSSEATATHDTFSITTNDAWLTSTVTKDKLVIAHEGAQTVVNSKGDTEAQTPKFGKSFKALSVSIDAKGHVAQLAEHTVTLPTPSLTNGTGNVVTGLTLEPTTGALTEKKANVGTLALTGYTTASSISAMPIATDSINTAIQKLAYVLDNKVDTVDTRIKALDSSITGLASGEAITGITIEDGKITKHTSNKFDLDGAASRAIEALNSTTAALKTNEVLTRVSLEKGKVTKAGTLQLGTAALKDSTAFVGANDDLSSKTITSGTNTATIAQMLARIIQLEEQVKELTTPTGS